MKTAISLPDELYKEAERIATSLGIPRSQLFARALEEFIALHERQGITRKLNEVYSQSEGAQAESELGLERLRELTKHDSW